jgi:hypothetical protein
MSPIQINFIRKGQSIEADDVMRIRASDVNQNLYRVEYEDRTVTIRNRLVATENEVLDYLYAVFALLPIDDDPFEAVQITCPTFPSVLLRVKDLGRAAVQSAVTTIIKTTMRNWPSSVKVSTDHLRSANPLSA